MELVNIIGISVAAFLTLSIYSFLYKDNPFYKLAEHIYVGMSAAYWLLFLYFFDVKPLLIDKFVSQAGFARWVLVIPAFFSVLMLMRFVPPAAWISRWSIAFSVGTGAGIGLVTALQGFVVPQMKASFVALWGSSGIIENINNIVIAVGVTTTLVYFYFSKEHKGGLRGTARVGMTFIMVAFGASFGYTVMARFSLLIGRMQFLLHNWLHIIR